MGAINFGTLTSASCLALVNQPETEEEEFFFADDLDHLQNEINNLKLYYFNLKIEYGYYEGFYLTLNEENTKLIYNNTKEKNEVLKELSAIKKNLINLVKSGILWGCHPSWVYNRLSTADTIREINEIIQELKNEVKASYTEHTARKQNKSIFEIANEYGAKEV